jgi:hypothetical protein
VAFAVGAFLVVIGAAMAVTGVKGRGEANAPVVWRPGRRFVVTTVLLFGYAALLEPVGYLPATFALMWGLFYAGRDGVAAGRRIVTSGLAAALTAGASYVIFSIWLRLQFPRGWLG